MSLYDGLDQFGLQVSCTIVYKNKILGRCFGVLERKRRPSVGKFVLVRRGGAKWLSCCINGIGKAFRVKSKNLIRFKEIMSERHSCLFAVIAGKKGTIFLIRDTKF